MKGMSGNSARLEITKTWRSKKWCKINYFPHDASNRS